MSNEKLKKIVGAAFENINLDEMKKIQGAGDTEAETLSFVLDSSKSCAVAISSIASMVSGIFGVGKD